MTPEQTSGSLLFEFYADGRVRCYLDGKEISRAEYDKRRDAWFDWNAEVFG